MVTNNLKQDKQAIWMFLVGILIGALMIGVFNALASQTKILYVSQDEIISFEKKRLERISDKTKIQLFNGSPQKAASLIEEIAKNFEDSNTKVVFSRGFVSGHGVKSISKDVHAMLIHRLTR